MKDEQDFVQSLLRHDEDVAVRPEHEQRIREGLAALLAAAPATSSGPTTSPSAPAHDGAPAELARSALRHWIATGVIAAAAAGGGFAAGRATAPLPAVVTSSPSSSVTMAPAPYASISSQPTGSVAAAPPATSASAVTSASPVTSSPLPPSQSDTFDREQSLLERARSALVHRDADAAQKALDEHAKQFPRSRHGEERDYLRIQVLRERGDADSLREAAAAFLAKYPDSLLRARVERLAAH